jgi:glutamate--cysteine ligase
MAPEARPISVPRLAAASAGMLHTIESRLLAHQADIEQWFHCQWQETPAPFYASVDLRNAGFKLAPVDTNLFPAGFNNLGSGFEPLCVHALQSAVERLLPLPCAMVLVPEDHTRNVRYWENIATLVRLLRLAGVNVRIGSVAADLAAAEPLPVAIDENPAREPLRRSGSRVTLADFDPGIILLNNDLSAGAPALLAGVEQIVTPPLCMGWSARRKSQHFALYDHVVEELTGLVGFDPWLVNPLFRRCGRIDFAKREGEECLSMHVADLLVAIKKKYREYGVEQEPFVFVKADSGTYGMNIMVVRSPDEVRDLNRKQRTKMARGKGGIAVTEMLVQEGVPTAESAGAESAVAEPVVYMIDHYVVGGFYRVHTGRGPTENLNAPGMHFEPLAFPQGCSTPDPRLAPDASVNRLYAYGVVARLALLAAAHEIAEAKGSRDKGQGAGENG